MRSASSLPATRVRRVRRVAEVLGARHLARRAERVARQQLGPRRARRAQRRVRLRGEARVPLAAVGRVDAVRLAAVLQHVVRAEVDVVGERVHLQPRGAQGGRHALVARARGRVVVLVVEHRARADAARQRRQLGREIAFEQGEVRAGRAQLLAQLAQAVEEELDDRRADQRAAQERRVEHERRARRARSPAAARNRAAWSSSRRSRRSQTSETGCSHSARSDDAGRRAAPLEPAPGAADQPSGRTARTAARPHLHDHPLLGVRLAHRAGAAALERPRGAGRELAHPALRRERRERGRGPGARSTWATTPTRWSACSPG